MDRFRPDTQEEIAGRAGNLPSFCGTNGTNGTRNGTAGTPNGTRGTAFGTLRTQTARPARARAPRVW